MDEDLKKFYSRLVGSKPLDPEIAVLVNEHFWELVMTDAKSKSDRIIGGEAEMFDLKPCPFCGKTDLDLTYEDHDRQVERIVYCNTCWLRGPEGLNDAEAAKLWNTRPLETNSVEDSFYTYWKHLEKTVTHERSPSHEAILMNLEYVLKQLGLIDSFRARFEKERKC